MGNALFAGRTPAASQYWARLRKDGNFLIAWQKRSGSSKPKA